MAKTVLAYLFVIVGLAALFALGFTAGRYGVAVVLWVGVAIVVGVVLVNFVTTVAAWAWQLIWAATTAALRVWQRIPVRRAAR